jgi:hypothetical protein
VPGGQALDNTLTSFVGFGDQVTFGASRWVRHEIGLGDSVDECSDAYNNLGVQAAATVFMFADGEGEIEASAKVEQIAARLGSDNGEVERAIHAVKRAAKYPGNPDVAVDGAGEAYPIGKDGRIGDSIGNLFDHLG